MPLKIRRIDCAAENALALLADLRRQLSPDGEVVPERGRELTVKVFGEALSPAASVRRIVQDVRARGLEAVRHYSQQFDRFDLTPESLRVGANELAAAHKQAEPAFLDVVRRVRRNITAFQSGILQRDAVLRNGDGLEVGVWYRPLRRVGVCIPGGAAAYPSTLLMTVCPAQAAGVGEIAVIAPPTKHGANNPDILATCHELGVTEVYRLGGAQGVAALAFGVDGLPPVDMIVGPGNLFVALAKREVAGHVAIDTLAGPSEVVVLADGSYPARFVASDLIAQAEHAPGASLLITWSPEVVAAVARELEGQLRSLPRGDLARESLESFGALILARSAEEAVRLTNAVAAEHVHVCTEDADRLGRQVDRAGAVFIGPWSPVALGDYVAGPSHVLPTGGSARFASGLSANDFLRRSSFVKCNRAALERLAPDVRVLAGREGLIGHSRSVDLRLESPPA
jgi:histidinol dehydrogenase